MTNSLQLAKQPWIAPSLFFAKCITLLYCTFVDTFFCSHIFKNHIGYYHLLKHPTPFLHSEMLVLQRH